MVSTDITVEILKENREEMRGLRTDNSSLRGEARESFERIDQHFVLQSQRAEVMETTLRDLAQQLVVLGRGVKVLLENRHDNDSRFTGLEKRVEALEQQLAARGG